MESFSSGMKKFDGTQYEVWSTLMDAVLTAKEIRYVLDDVKPESDGTARIKWDKDNRTAKAVILLSLDESIIRLVLSCDTAKDVWQRLAEVHSQQSESSKMMLLQEFYSIKMQPGSKVSAYVSQTELIAKKLKDAGVSIEEETLIGKIVSGLSSDFKHFMTSWMATAESDRKLAKLLPRLMAEESVITRDDPVGAAAMKAATNLGQGQGQQKGKKDKKDKKDIECYFCHKKGHMKRDCRKLKKQ